MEDIKTWLVGLSTLTVKDSPFSTPHTDPTPVLKSKPVHFNIEVSYDSSSVNLYV